MRIISGRFKGRHLVSFSASHIRPTTDRVKESIFNKLMYDLDEAYVLDLFSGTGNLGLEALSRGASKVVAVEKNKKSVQIIKRNLKELKVESDEFEVLPFDVLKFLKNYSEKKFQVIFIDPPFTQKMAHDVMNALAISKTFEPGTKVMIESTKHERIDDVYGVFQLLDRKNYGDKNLSFFKVEESDA